MKLMLSAFLAAIPNSIAAKSEGDAIAAPGHMTASAATRLAELAFPDDIIAKNLASDRSFQTQGCATDPRMLKLEQTRPGICAEITDAYLTVSEVIYREEIAHVRREAAQIYAATLTEAEGQEMVTALTSPAGRKLIASYYVGVANANNGSRSLSELAAVGSKSANNSLSSSDLKQLAAIETPELMAKRKRIDLAFSKLSQESWQRIEAGRQARVGPEIRAVLIKHGILAR